jgi:hypothetical protein
VTDAALEARLRTAAPTDRERWEQHQHGLRSRYGAVPRDETASQETEEERTARMRRALGPRHVPPGTPRPRLTPEEQFSRLHAYQVKLDRFERETSLYDEEEQQRAKKQQVFDKHQTRFDPLKETIVPGLRPYTPPTGSRGYPALGGGPRQDRGTLRSSVPREVEPVHREEEKQAQNVVAARRRELRSSVPREVAPEPQTQMAQNVAAMRRRELRSSVPRETGPEPAAKKPRSQDVAEMRKRELRSSVPRDTNPIFEPTPERGATLLRDPTTGRGAALGDEPISLTGSKKTALEKLLFKRKQKDYRTAEQKEDQETQQRDRYAGVVDAAQPTEAPRAGRLYPKTFEATGGAARAAAPLREPERMREWEQTRAKFVYRKKEKDRLGAIRGRYAAEEKPGRERSRSRERVEKKTRERSRTRSPAPAPRSEEEEEEVKTAEAEPPTPEPSPEPVARDPTTKEQFVDPEWRARVSGKRPGEAVDDREAPIVARARDDPGTETLREEKERQARDEQNRRDEERDARHEAAKMRQARLDTERRALEEEKRRHKEVANEAQRRGDVHAVIPNKSIKMREQKLFKKESSVAYAAQKRDRDFETGEQQKAGKLQRLEAPKSL